MRLEQTAQYYASRERNFETAISYYETLKESAVDQNNDDDLRRYENTLRLLRHNLGELHTRREAEEERIKREAYLKVTSTITSLNLIKIV